MDPNFAEAERNLNIANRLLAAHDLVGAKRFAELAIDNFPQRSDDRPDQILAVADVLLSSQKRINNHYDWYSILQLSNPGSSSSSDQLLKRNYRRLNLLLHPDRNRSPNADSAFRLIVDAYSVLSDPTKKSLFDAELNISGSNLMDDHLIVPSFWTTCNSCHHVFQYHREYVNKTLRCKTCRKAFHAVELQRPPSVVPGTNMYYATWGFFPLGVADGSDYKPFVLMQNPPSGGGFGQTTQPRSSAQNNHHHHQQQQQQQPHSGGGGQTGTTTGRNKKKPARKKVMSGFKNRTFHLGNVNLDHRHDKQPNDYDDDEEEEEEEVRGININEAAKGLEDGGGVGTEDIDMIIDLDTADEMLGNLHNLPFLKDDGINMGTPYGGIGRV